MDDRRIGVIYCSCGRGMAFQPVGGSYFCSVCGKRYWIRDKEEDLEIIAQRMREIADRNLPITHRQISKEKARELYKNNPFKLELILFSIT